MPPLMRSPFVRHASLTVLLVATMALPVWAQPSRPLSVPPGPAATAQIPMLRDVGIDQKLDGQIPLDTPFFDHDGRDVTLRQYFRGKPVVLAFAYYECPLLCTQVLNGVVGSLEGVKFIAGRDFEVVIVSIDPGETPAMAAAKRTQFLKRYGRKDADGGVHFLTGRQDAITALTGAAGFRYAYDAAIDQYAHSAAMMLLTPEGRMSRYLFGIEFAPRDVQLALVEASDRKIGTVIDDVLLFCYHYDPETGTYGFAIMSMVRAAGILTVAALGAFILVALRRDRRQASAAKPTATGTR